MNRDSSFLQTEDNGNPGRNLISTDKRHRRHMTAHQVQQVKQSQPRVTCSLLIPAELLAYVRVRCQQHRGLKKFFGHLLSTYGCNLDYYALEPHYSGPRKLYQQSGAGYVRLDFQPDLADWEQMRILSYTYGPSICWLFVFLVRLEMKRWRAAGQPDYFQEQAPEWSGYSESARNSVNSSQRAADLLRQVSKEASDFILQLRLWDRRQLKLVRFGLFQL
ncbi:MAG: DUF1564 family protein [Leptospiraceae bacterium]|nr:DUF1564 family protein [Leptospiraceae bacterium]